VKRFGDVRKHNYSQADHAEYLQNPQYRDRSWFHFDSLCARGGVLRTVKDARPPVL
jgi:hypothetical protein